MRRLSLFIVLLAAFVAGCGGGDATQPADPTAALTPAEIQQQAREAAAATTSFKVAMTADVVGTPRAGGTPGALEALISRPLGVSVDGRASRPHAMAMETELSVQALPIALTLIQKDDGLYLDVVGQGFELATQKGSVVAIEPANMPLALIEWMSAPEVAGRETVNEARTVHLRGALDRKSLADLGGLVAVLGGRAAPRGDSTASIGKGEIDLWVGTDDLRLYRAGFSLETSGELQGLDGLSTLSLTATLDFTDHDQPVEITAPTETRPLRLDELSGLLGG